MSSNQTIHFGILVQCILDLSLVFLWGFTVNTRVRMAYRAYRDMQGFRAICWNLFVVPTAATVVYLLIGMHLVAYILHLPFSPQTEIITG